MIHDKRQLQVTSGTHRRTRSRLFLLQNARSIRQPARISVRPHTDTGAPAEALGREVDLLAPQAPAAIPVLNVDDQDFDRPLNSDRQPSQDHPVQDRPRFMENAAGRLTPLYYPDSPAPNTHQPPPPPPPPPHLIQVVTANILPPSPTLAELQMLVTRITAYAEIRALRIRIDAFFASRQPSDPMDLHPSWDEVNYRIQFLTRACEYQRAYGIWPDDETDIWTPLLATLLPYVWNSRG